MGSLLFFLGWKNKVYLMWQSSIVKKVSGDQINISIEATGEILNKHLSEYDLTLVINTTIKLTVAILLGGAVSPNSGRYHSF